MVDFSVCPVIQLSIVWHKSRTILPLFTNPLQYGLVNICLQQCHVCCYAILSTFVADGKVEKSQQDPWGSKVLQSQLNSEKKLNDLLGTLPHALNLRPSQDSLESAACPWRGRLQILTIAQSFDVTYFQCSACFYRVRSGSGSISRAISPCISPSTVQVYNCTCISLGALNTALFFFRTSSVSPRQ